MLPLNRTNSSLGASPTACLRLAVYAKWLMTPSLTSKRLRYTEQIFPQGEESMLLAVRGISVDILVNVHITSGVTAPPLPCDGTVPLERLYREYGGHFKNYDSRGEDPLALTDSHGVVDVTSIWRECPTSDYSHLKAGGAYCSRFISSSRRAKEKDVRCSWYVSRTRLGVAIITDPLLYGRC